MTGLSEPKAEGRLRQTGAAEFAALFQRLSGYPPLTWQSRLFQILRFAPRENWPDHLDLPTGLGKTSVIHIWLIALIQQLSERARQLPLRLIYVVDRRTVVDQATDIAMQLKKKVDEDRSLLGGPLPVSTLRGLYADNREWTSDISRPAIVIGTIDLIGSRLLFSGYRSSYKMRPVDAGLLGQDAFLVLDEAHLSKPFAKLTKAVEQLNLGTRLPIKVMHMSATGADGDLKTFKLEESDLAGTRDVNPAVRRFGSEKRLTIHEGIQNSVSALTKKAVELANDNSRVVVFVRSPKDASKIANAIQSYGNQKLKAFANSVEVLTGTMRGLERDELLQKKPVIKRFMAPANRPGEGPAVLVSTSAGEVGFDLNADHLVCDAAPLDSLIQRFGRVNRRGDGKAEVHLFAQKQTEKKGREENVSSAKRSFESASIVAVATLKKLPKISKCPDVYDASPKAFADLPKPEEALSPAPEMVELTDVLLDSWSMTTIAKSMPGRPPVGPWLRGVEAEAPQTTFAWRAELDIPGFSELEIESIEEWLDAHRLLPHETLTVPTKEAAEWIVARWQLLGNEPRDRRCIVDHGGVTLLKLQDLISRLETYEKKNAETISNADIVLPASFGGIERGAGLLDASAPKPVNADGESAAAAPDLSSVIPDVADEGDTEKPRYRMLKVVKDDTESCEPLAGAGPAKLANFSEFSIDLPCSDDTRRQLISRALKRARPEFGTERQSLKEHVALVESRVSRISEQLALPNDLRSAVSLAAAWHDHGKNREIWQRAVNRQPGEPAIGKSGGRMRPVAGRYRHEFGSLREFAEEYEGKLERGVFDLAMHLIATHHGRGRPHFPKGGFDPENRASGPRIATDAIRRFAKLQRQYGHWQLAWLENLLRCADALASMNSGKGQKVSS